MDTQYYHVFCTSSPFQICSEASLWTKNPQVSVLLSVGAPHNLVTQNTVRCEIHTIVFYWDQIFHNYWITMLLLVVSYFCQTMRILYFFPPQKSSSFPEIGWFTRVLHWRPRGHASHGWFFWNWRDSPQHHPGWDAQTCLQRRWLINDWKNGHSGPGTENEAHPAWCAWRVKTNDDENLESTRHFIV